MMIVKPTVRMAVFAGSVANWAIPAKMVKTNAAANASGSVTQLRFGREGDRSLPER
jgi:hypothetical protein